MLVGQGELDLAAYRGRWVLVDFWASWCAPCQLSLPAYQRLYDELRAEGQAERFEILAINIDAQRRDAERVLRRTPLSYPLMADPQGRHPERWALPAMPTAYLVDPEGRVHHVHAGFRAGDEAETRARVRAALGLD
jgi:thiol-disulfide isomerase/thioredoxin